ncbi:hypothetical protein [Desulfocicer vacuolatum]|uniref:hypothetical protein n=1 Tax=Desulfocicer vacuolatum TaxID=2298 RepID=UPI00111BD219|nr:hypothetical protein [Desulfocicer vacuolatum]
MKIKETPETPCRQRFQMILRHTWTPKSQKNQDKKKLGTPFAIYTFHRAVSHFSAANTSIFYSGDKR